MVKNTSDNSIQETQPSKKKLRLKVILYILLILILLIFILTIYFKVKDYLEAKGIIPSNSVSINIKEDPRDSINTNMIQELLQNQQNFQQEVYDKIHDLSNEIKHKQYIPPEGENIPVKDPTQVILLEKKQPTTEIISKYNVKENFNSIYYLINVLNTHNSFLTELETFRTMPESKYFSHELSSLYNVASQGVPTCYDLTLRFNELEPYIKVQSYKLDKSIWGKIKYYLSFLIIVQKKKNFNEKDFSLDSKLYYIEKYLLEGKPSQALYIVNNNLRDIKGLDTWIADLNYRVIVENFVFNLQQFLLNSLQVEN